jgi:membrane protein DedA with SNARE-associated domain
LENFLHSLSELSDVWIYAAIFFLAYLENLFPPSPSDMVIIFGGSLAGIGRIDFVGALAVATAGSTLGFVTMFGVGHWFGVRILESGKLRFIPKESVDKVEGWFRRYGNLIIVVNRFLTGTRAVVSFFAGMSHMRLLTTTVLCFLSALTWNTILVSMGRLVGQNWERIGVYLATYSQTVTAVIIVVVLVLVAKYLYGRKKKKRNSR